MRHHFKQPSFAIWGPLCLLLLATTAVVPVLAQSGANTGLAGRVVDESDAVLPGVDITITRVETGEERAVVSDELGDWEARFLSPGSYRLVFILPGFKTMNREGVTVTTAQIGTVNVTMEIGEIAVTVDVRGDAEMVSSTSAAVVRDLAVKELEGLPTSSRNFTQLLVIQPGVSADISDLLSNNNASISPSVNGARTTNNSFSYNGIDVTNLLCCNSRVNGSRGTIDEGGGSLSRNIAPAPETLQEVKLQTSLYDASTGRNGGGNFQLVSKSGTNEFHGTGYYFFQHDALIANDFFFNRFGLEKPLLRRHEAGFTIGGPIIANKTFFFGSYQYTSAKTSYVDEASSSVRMPQALTDDRSDAGIDQFASDIGVDPADINPISRSFLKATFEDGSLLMPSGAGGRDCTTDEDQDYPACEILAVEPATFHQHQLSANIDHNFTDANRFAARFFFSDQPSMDPISNNDALTRFERLEDTQQYTLSFNDTHIFNPTLINEFRAGFFRNKNDTAAQPYFTNEEFGINNPLADVRPDLARINIRSPRDVGEEFEFGTPDDQILDVQKTFTVGDTMSFTKGAHSIKFGGEYRRNHLDGTLQETQNGEFRVDNSWKNFLEVGKPDDKGRTRQFDDISLNYGETIRGYRFNDVSLFVADDWKVSPKFTVNIGVRWEMFGHPYESGGILNNFDVHLAEETNDIWEGLTFASNFDPNCCEGFDEVTVRYSDTKSTLTNDYNNLAPRLGIAWSPTDGLVIRGGYGMFYERTSGAFANSLRQAFPFFREAQLNKQGDWNAFPQDSAQVPVPDFIVGFDDGEPFLATADDPDTEYEAFEAQFIPPYIATPYIQQWSLNVQWEFKRDLLLEVGYVGTKGTKLLQILNDNQALDINQVGFLDRPGVPGGGFSTNYYDIVDDEFVPSETPPCDVSDDPGDCVIPSELRLPVMGFDEDEGVNSAFSNSNSIYNALQLGLQKRFSSSYMFNINYTFSKSIDTFSDEGKYQIEHDQTRPFLNRAVSDFHRPHRFIASWVWDLPQKEHVLLKGWSFNGILTLQSGRPFSVIDDDYSGYLYSSRNPRPNLAEGATHDDLVTHGGSVSSRVDNYLNPDALEHSWDKFGDLGRNVVYGPGQNRIDLVLTKITMITEQKSLEFRAEFFNAFNHPSFRNPENDWSDSDYGEIDETRGGPRVIQFGLKFRF
jgi:hypothetical protein